MVRKIGKFIFNAAIYIAIVMAIVWGLPEFLSWKLKTPYPIAAITSGSMWPALKTGDLVLIEAVPEESLAVGDIVVWRNAKGFAIHRVTALRPKTLVTKGDANFTEDDPVAYDDIVGRAVEFRNKPFRIPLLGNISMAGMAFGGTSK